MMEFGLLDLISYLVVIGSEFVSLCAITRVGRGWALQAVGFAALVAVNVVMECIWQQGGLALDVWLALVFCSLLCVCCTSVIVLSRDSLGRRIFMAIEYGAFGAFFAPFMHLLAYRNVFGLPDTAAVLVGVAFVVLVNLAFVFWVLPQVPRDNGSFSWSGPCFAAGALLCTLVACGIWPISVLTAPSLHCAPFAFAAVAALSVFPVLFRSMREHRRAIDVAHGLELLTIEMKERRAAIDEARRIRHDQRHHRVQIGEYMLNRQYDKVLAYLRELDDEAEAVPTDRLVWCENETINAILSSCGRKASARGVGFSAVATVERMVPLPDVEIVAVFANLIENAIAATGRGVEVSIRQRENGIGIKVTNTVPTDFALSSAGLPCEEPGIGLESVRRVVERRGGQWRYSLDDGVLTCQVALTFDHPKK